MKWKDKFTQLNIGDKVKVIIKNPNCNGCNNCAGRIGSVLDINCESSYGEIYVQWSSESMRCNIPAMCLKKI